MVESEVTNELLLTIPLRKAKFSSKARRADTVMGIIREHVARYTKSPKDRVWIDTRVNEEIWKRGRTNIPSHIQVKVIKLQEGTTEVIIP
jgi:large subunit ribosomal protein L31e